MADEADPFLDWEKNVPAGLIPAVKHLRELFSEADRKCNWTTKAWCYAAMHPNQADKIAEAKGYGPALGTLKALIGPSYLQYFEHQLGQDTPSSMLHAFFFMYEEAMSTQVGAAFNNLLAIGNSHAMSISSPPIDWAAWHTKSMIHGAAYQVESWLKTCCDIQPYIPGDSDESIYWRKWQAPRLVLMKPSLGAPFDASRVWEREDVETSLHVAEAYKDFFVRHLESVLKECVGRSHVEAAVKGCEPAAKRQEPSSDEAKSTLPLLEAELTYLHSPKAKEDYIAKEQRRLAGAALGSGLPHASGSLLDRRETVEEGAMRRLRAAQEQARQEIEAAKQNEARQLAERSAALQSTEAIDAQGKPASPSEWRQLHDDFMNIVTEERKHWPSPHRRQKGYRVHGLVASSVPGPNGKPGIGWIVHQSPTEKIKVDYELVATRAGRALGQAPDTVDGPLNHWLHALRSYLSTNRSKWLKRLKWQDQLSGAEENIWQISSVCEASAAFCRRQEKAALESKRQQAADEGANPPVDTREAGHELKLSGPAKGGLLAMSREAKRKAALEERLRSEALIGGLFTSDPRRKELQQALLEIAIPLIDRAKRKEEATQRAPLSPPPGILPPRSLSSMTAFPRLGSREPVPERTRKKRRTTKSKAQLKRAQVIFGAIQAGLKGLKYCGELDSKKLQILADWKDTGCPNSYGAAYKQGEPWRKRIQDEKYRHQVMYDAESPKERERIIEGNTSTTRSTRS